MFFFAFLYLSPTHLRWQNARFAYLFSNKRFSALEISLFNNSKTAFRNGVDKIHAMHILFAHCESIESHISLRIFQLKCLYERAARISKNVIEKLFSFAKYMFEVRWTTETGYSLYLEFFRVKHSIWIISVAPVKYTHEAALAKSINRNSTRKCICYYDVHT